MKAEILKNLDNPGELEILYRQDQKLFAQSFNELYPEIQYHKTAEVWHARINYTKPELTWGGSTDWTFLLISILMAGFIAKIPQATGMDEDFFFPRNISFIVFPFLTAFFAWKRQLTLTAVASLGALFIASAVYINMLPEYGEGHTLVLACIHLPLFLWSVLGFSFVGAERQNLYARLSYLRYNGDLVILSGLILIAGMILTGVSFGLFELIDVNIESVFEHYILIWALPAIPILASYLVTSNPQLINKVSPVIARVFTPLVLVMLFLYLAAVLYTGKDPYNDREFLLIFNLLLIGVMAIILFSIAETSRKSANQLGVLLLLALSLVTVVVNGIALSAILFRISEWGFTPNRIAVLGGNVLILVNLLIVTYRLFQVVRKTGDLDCVEAGIAAYLPVYSIWTILVTFLFPVLFGFQ